MNKKIKEIRHCERAIVTASESRKVEGYALVFDSKSVDLGGFYEVIDKRALDGVLEQSDVLALLNHEVDRGVLARWRMSSGGSLELEVDDIGLRYSFEAPSFALGDELLEGIKRGDITSSSFAFDVESDVWEKSGDSYIRTIKKIGKLYDVSPVYHPAYPATSVDARGLDALKADEKRIEDEKRKADEEAKAKELAELNAYYSELRKL